MSSGWTFPENRRLASTDHQQPALTKTRLRHRHQANQGLVLPAEWTFSERATRQFAVLALLVMLVGVDPAEHAARLTDLDEVAVGVA